MDTRALLKGAYALLSREAKSTQELEELKISLEKAFAITPELLVSQGIVQEFLEPSVAIVPVAARTVYEEALAIYRMFAEIKAYKHRALVNQCILYDRLRNGKALKKQLQEMPHFSDTSYDVWFALGALCHKVSLYQQALIYFDKALDIRPNAPDALLKKAYCLEGLVRLRESEQCFLKVLNLESVGEQEGQDKDAYEEVCHGLGHVYTELGDREQGIRYMKAARDMSPIYMCCYAAIHSELKDFETALKLLEEALKHPHYLEDQEGRNELIFYRGEALSGLLRFVEADRDFKTFEEFSRDRGDTDAVAHAAIFQVKSLMKRSDLQSLSIEDLKAYRTKLVDSPLTEYANVFIHKEYDQLLEILDAYVKIKEALANSDAEIVSLDEPISKLRGTIGAQERLRLLLLTDRPGLIPDSEILDYADSDEALLCDVWLVIAHDELSSENLVLLSKHAESRSIIIAGFGELNLPARLRDDVMLIKDDLAAATRIAELTLLLDHSRRYIAEVKPIYAMAPVKTAPSFVSAQAGEVFPIPLIR